MTIANGEAIAVVLPSNELYVDLKGTYDQTEEDQPGRKRTEAHDSWMQPAGHNVHGHLDHPREGARRGKEELVYICMLRLYHYWTAGPPMRELHTRPTNEEGSWISYRQVAS